MDISKMQLSRAVLSRIRRGSLFHAYIISGRTKEERMTLARAIAKATVCAVPGENPCGQCENCYKAERNIHPDIMVITKLEDKKEIIIDQIRKAISDTAVMPNEADKKVYIIDEADGLNPPAQNAMLKILEEPPHHVQFILLAENARALLPTVRSRCTELNITPERGSFQAESETRRILEMLLRRDSMEILRFAFSTEKLEREQLSELATEICRFASEEMKKDENASERKELLHIAEVFLKIQRYTEANVSSGHAMSLLLAEFA